MQVINEIKNNPVMLIVGIIIVVNLFVGDPTQTEALVESLILLGGGLIARAKVTPMRKVRNDVSD